MNFRDLSGRRRLRAAIASTIGSIRQRPAADAAEPLYLLATSSARTMRTCVLELAYANAEMLHSLRRRSPGHRRTIDTVVTVQSLRQDGTQVDIDEIEPAQRAATRIVLAIANGNPGDADVHLDIAAEAAESDALRDVLANTVVWTLELLDQCAESDRPVPTWLRPVLTDR
jgi:hypothetical protein